MGKLPQRYNKMAKLHNKQLSMYINYCLILKTRGVRTFYGTLLSFDKYLNLIISECEELIISYHRIFKMKKQGLVVFRGDFLCSIMFVGPSSNQKLIDSLNHWSKYKKENPNVIIKMERNMEYKQNFDN